MLDDDDNVVQMPFKKIFNYGENKTLVGRDTPVMAVSKINGFMGAATWYKDQLLISTTGSLTSDFVGMAREHLDKPSIRDLCANYPNDTFLFEIVDVRDPHIVPEEPGAYLIGARAKRLGSPLWPEMSLDNLLDDDSLDENLAKDIKRPAWCTGRFGDVKAELMKAQHEGAVIRDLNTGEPLCKIKTPFYLSKKTLMRLGQKGVELLWANPDKFKERLDEEFYGVADHIRTTYTAEQWAALKDVERRPIIEKFFNDQQETA